VNAPAHLKRPSQLKDLALALLLAAAGAAFACYAYATRQSYIARAVRPSDGCLAYRPVPATLVVIGDRTDRLTGSQPRRWLSAVDDALGHMPSGSKVYFTNIGPTAPVEISFPPALCVPEPGDAKHAEDLRKQIRQDEQALEAAAATRYSAIAETILVAARDHAFRGVSTKTIIVASDFLENTPSSSVYRRRGFALPPVANLPFKNTVMHLVVLQNLRDERFQTRRLIDGKWIAWMRAGGASRVEVDADWLGYGQVQLAKGANP